jgi:hypothetical protein
VNEFITHDNGVDRPMTDEEVAAYLEVKASSDADEIVRAAAAAARQSARTKLAALGLTDEEVSALLGG